jgi:pimeloyl-ACP methyl ester carboxylesterase
MRDYRNPFEGYRDALPQEISAAGFEQDFAVVGDVTLSYLRGPANGTPLLLVPAQMGTWRTYAPVMPALAEQFEVFVVELRGHGSSTWTPGDYSWDSVGADLREFLRSMVGRPAIVSGNSSGGILALWLAATAPDLVQAIILEDAPVFSVELPRFKQRDRFVYRGLEHIATSLGDPRTRNLADYFRGLELPKSENRSKKLPEWFVRVLEGGIARFAATHPGEPAGIDIWWLPKSLGDVFRSLSMFDPDFARAFVDDRFYVDFSHASALESVRCPVLVLHANWKRFDNHGLVGAMDDDDAGRIMQLVPHAQYLKIAANHVIHRYKPREFVAAVKEFAS